MKQLNKVLCSVVALAAVAMLAASCTKEMMTKDAFFEGLYEKCTIEAEATLPGPGDADSTAKGDKAYVDGTTRNVIWQSGDRLNINGTSLTVATIDSGGVRAKFYGTVNGIVSGNNLRFWAVYPPSVASQFTNPNNLTFTLPSTQTYDPSKQPLQGYSYMVGYTEVPQDFHRLRFQMRNLGSVLKLTLSAKSDDLAKRITKIEFTSSDANLTGDFTVNNNSASPTISEGSTGTKKLVVKFTGGSLDISSTKTVYVFLPPLNGKNLSIKIYGGYGLVPYVEVKKSDNIHLLRNTIYNCTVSNITFDKVFTVANNNGTLRKVIFSPGNLQWSSSNGTTTATTHTVAGGGTKAGTWRFAANQWNYVGANYDGTVYGNVYGVNGNTSTRCDNNNIASAYKGWIDLYGWATSGVGLGPWSTSTGNSAYGGNGNNNLTGDYKNYDWGVYNAIYNPRTGLTDPPGTWRTLTESEWNYLLFSRGGQRYAKATVNGVKGLIIMPDGWSTSTYTLNNRNTANSNFSSNTITAAQWTTLENSGCVFIPACGYRYKRSSDTYVTRVVPGTTVYIWTATKVDANCARHLRCEDGHLEFNSGSTNAGMGRAEGFAVRLAKTK